jgi:SAM-dependent methyltransferase
VAKSGSDTLYALGSTGAEHERLIRQATLLAPCTERLFREAGIEPGHRVLDLGSGIGDVAMLVARLVGPSGEVVGAERDKNSIARAKARAIRAGLQNISFIQSDVCDIASETPFDAVVGRFILEFVPNPVAVLRVVSRVVRPGGILAFQEPSYAPFLLMSAHLPLWSAGVSLIHERFDAPGPIQRSALHCTGSSRTLAYRRPVCEWRCCLAAIQISRDGSPIFSAASDLKSRIRTFLSHHWATWILSRRDFIPRSRHQKLWFHSLHS